MDTAYGICWLNQSLPTYTTEDVAFLPFAPLQESSTKFPTELWSTDTLAFHTNLTCFPAETQMKSTGYTFSNGKGCIVPNVALVNTADSVRYMVTYIGYFDNPQNDWSLQNPNCSSEFSNTFLAIWASHSSRIDSGKYSNLTAIFCEATYTSQEMTVMVNSTTREVQGFKPTDRDTSQVDLKDIFNITNFEYLLGAGVPSASQKQNFPDMTILQQQSKIMDFGITWPNSNMVGFAVALADAPIDDWSQPAILQRVFEKAHQLLFVTALSTLTKATAEVLDARPGVRLDSPGAVILIRPISIAVEVGFGAIILFIACLWYFYHKRPTKLQFDLASTTDIMSMIHPDGEITSVMHDDGTLTSSELDNILSQKTYTIVSEKSGNLYIRPDLSHKKGHCRKLSARAPEIRDKKQPFSPVQPVELRLLSGMVFITLLVAAVVGILLLYFWSLKNDGKLRYQPS
jgi:hypothetical protein